MGKLLNLVKKIPIKKEEIFLKFLKSKEKAIVEWLKEKKFKCVLDTDLETQTLTIFSCDEKMLENCQKELEDEIKIFHYNIPSIVYDNTVLNDFIHDVKNDIDCIFEITEDTIKICGFADEVQKAYNKILNLIDQ